MFKDDALAVPTDLTAAIGLLTRLPVRVDTDRAMARGARAAWAWPLAGVCVNGLAAAAAGVTLWIGLPPGIAALILIATQIALTGAMHEDGLADSADGLWGGWDRARRLAIMKDSQIGTYGVLALGLSLLLRWQLWSLLIAGLMLWPAALAAGALTRLPMIALTWGLPAARAGGLSRTVGRPATATLALGAGITVLLCALALGIGACAALATVFAATLLWAVIARHKIGGQTGDILGAAQQIADVTALLTLAALV